MNRTDFSLLMLSVWLIASNLADGFFQIFSFCMTVAWSLIFFMYRYAEWRDSRHKGEWQETWHR